METHSSGLTLADRLVADGKGLFTFADALQVPGLANRLRPLNNPTADLNLNPATPAYSWRDPHWRIRWPIPLKELKAGT